MPVRLRRQRRRRKFEGRRKRSRHEGHHESWDGDRTSGKFAMITLVCVRERENPRIWGIKAAELSSIGVKDADDKAPIAPSLPPETEKGKGRATFMSPLWSADESASGGDSDFTSPGLPTSEGGASNE